MMLPHPPGVVATLSTVVLSLALAGCADDAEPTSQESATAEETTESATPSRTPETAESTSTMTASTEPAATATATAEQSDTQAGPVDPASSLLPASKVGKLNAEWRWRAGNDFDTEPDRLVACHRAALVDLGAEQVAVREYTSDLDANTAAFHLVAAMPDDKTAQRLYAVLESWQADCRRRLEARNRGDDGVKVSDLERLDTGAEAAATYVVMQPTATGSARIENVGIARAGRAVQVVVVKLEGQDFNYPRGRTPAAVTLRNAATG